MRKMIPPIPAATRAVKALAIAVAGFAAGAAMQAFAALPPTSAGYPDPTYGTGGALVLTVRNGYENVRAIVPLPDGRWLISGGAQSAGQQEDGIRYLARLQPDGRLDPSFGSGGLVFDHRYSAVIATQSTGRILAASVVDDGSLQRGSLERLLPNGAADASFGTGGRTVLDTAAAATPFQDFESLAVDAQDRILATARMYNNAYSVGKVEVWRFTGEGLPDPAFGTAGHVALDDAGTVVYNSIVREQGDGRIVVATWCQASLGTPTQMCVVRLNANGTRDASFGPNGLRRITAPAGTSYPLYDVQIGADGKAYIAASAFGNGANAIVVRLNADGTPDAGFGQGGIAKLTWTGQSAYAFSVFPRADGKVIVVGAVNESIGQSFGYAARLTAAGQLDPTFGVNGISPRVGTNPTWFDKGAVLADGAILGLGRSSAVPDAFDDVDSLVVRIVGVETTTPVVEFHNTTLDHYFITADPVEAAAIDAGAAGPGWARTGKGFKSGGPSRVCRNYGSSEIDPATGARRGPNSHVYSIEAVECLAIRADPGWHFESYDFSGWLRLAPACPAGTVGVYRAYNGRFAQNDSNHRYTIEPAVYNTMVAQGWSGEGIVFCAVQ